MIASRERPLQLFRLAPAAAAQLPGGNPRRALRVRRAGARPARALPDVARAGDALRGARGPAL